MITLASDFGSPYPAAMRGVLLSRCDARLVDVAHDFPRGDVRAGAFWLRFVLPEFPPAVHLAVVDPGVGTDRRVLVVRVGGHALVGPDNGLLVPAARRLVGSAPRRGPPATGQHERVETDTPVTGGDSTDSEQPPGSSRIEVFLADPGTPDSATFHGRDVFAPLAADVHRVGVDALGGLDRLDPAGEWVDLAFPEPTVADGAVTGEVLAVDGFGNVITNVPGDVVADLEAVRVDGERVPVGSTFAAVDSGRRLVTVGSHGNVECDVNGGRGDEAFGLSAGDSVRIELA